MKKVLAAFGLLFCATLGYAQTAVLPIYACILPGSQALTSGLKSTNFQVGVIPACTVTIYITETTNIATTTPQSPFVANSNGAIVPVTASTLQSYDVKFSGGLGNPNCTTAPNCYTTPYTLTDVSSGGGGSSGVTSFNSRTGAVVPAAGDYSTSLLSDWTNAGVSNGYCILWNSGTLKWTPGTCGGSSTWASITNGGAGGGTQTGSGLSQLNTLPGGLATASSPVCDPRALGATLGSGSDIGPYIQDCINQAYPYAPGNTQTIVLHCGNGSPYCYWANPSALTFTNVCGVKIEIEGYLKLGSPLLTNSCENFYGIGPPGGDLQFQKGTPAQITAPAIYGTLGTSISAGAITTVTPTFGVGTIAQMPAGVAITVSETTTCSSAGAPCSANATGSASSGTAVLILPAQVRYVALEPLTVSGCSNSALNITNGIITKVDYSATGGETVTYLISSSSTISGVTGCSVTSFDEDKYESLRIFCGYPYTGGVGTVITGAPGGTSCATNQWAVYPLHAHSASAQWGAVAVVPSYGEQGGHTFHDLNIQGSYGMSYWGEQESNGDLYNVGMSPTGYLSAGGMEQTASWVMQIGELYYSPTNANPASCTTGGCGPVSYPYGLRCDSESGGLSGGGGSGTNTGCASSTIKGGAFIGGGIKIDGGGVNQITALPYEISGFLLEQVQYGLEIDNRSTADPTNCLDFKNNSLQDNITQQTPSYIAYTNNKPASYSCISTEGNSTALTGNLVNPYFNDALAIGRATYGTVLPAQPVNNPAATPPINDGVEMQGAVRGGSAGLGPQILPFGSLAIDNSPADWATDCVSAGCTVATTNVSCPDGPQVSSKMQCGEIRGPGNAFIIATWTGSTYTGDQFIYGCWVRPGANYSYPIGLAPQDVFFLQTAGTDTFGGNPNGTNLTYPSFGFGTKIGHNTWYPLIAIGTVTSGYATSHNINFYISSGNGNGGVSGAGYGNQISNCRWAFVPGPNNPSYAGVTQDEVNFARDNQYRGAVPSTAVTAGVAATLEPVQFSNVAASSGHACLHADTSGNITNTGSDCGSGGGSSPGTITLSSSRSALSADAGNIIKLNGFAYTLPATQPGNPWSVVIQEDSGGTGSVALASGATYNSGTSAPPLLAYQIISLAATTGSTTDYTGSLPLASGANTTLTPSSNKMTVASSGGGGDTITSPNSTLSVGGTSTATTLDFNLSHQNTWALGATQTFNGGINIGAQGTATSGGNISSNEMAMYASYWNGSAATADQWYFIDIPSTGTNPSVTFSLTHTGSPGVASVNLPYPVSASALSVGGKFLTNQEYSNGTCTTAATITPVNGPKQNVTLTNGDTCALTFTQPTGATATIDLKVIQSTTSSYNGTISGCVWPGASTPAITATSGAIDFIKVYLDGTNAFCSIVQNYVITPTAATPTFSPVAGVIASGTTIAITSSTSGVTICYTLDGSTPTATTPGTCSHGTSISNGGSTTGITTALTVEAIATEVGYTNSSVGSAAYTISSGCSAPTGSFTYWWTPSNSPGGSSYPGMTEANASNYATAPVSADAPTYSATGGPNSQPMVTISASPQEMQLATAIPTTAGDYTFMVVINDLNTSSGGTIIGNDYSPTARGFAWVYGASGSAAITKFTNMGVADIGSSTTLTNNGTWTVHGVTYHAATGAYTFALCAGGTCTADGSGTGGAYTPTNGMNAFGVGFGAYIDAEYAQAAYYNGIMSLSTMTSTMGAYASCHFGL